MFIVQTNLDPQILMVLQELHSSFQKLVLKAHAASSGSRIWSICCARTSRLYSCTVALLTMRCALRNSSNGHSHRSNGHSHRSNGHSHSSKAHVSAIGLEPSPHDDGWRYGTFLGYSSCLGGTTITNAFNPDAPFSAFVPAVSV